MTFEKRTLTKSDMGYAVYTMRIAGERRVIAASESTGPAVVFDGPELMPRVLATAPGGTMGFAELPGRDDALLIITRFYPIFKAEEAGIDLFVGSNGLAEPWKGKRVIDLPFVHRMATVKTSRGDYLVAATVCGGKEFQDDWSKPGTVFAYPIPDDPSGPWVAQPILENVHKNHGLTTGLFGGVASLLISATEGVFALSLPGATSPAGEALPDWSCTRVIDHEVSEMGLCDFDGDGVDELAVIEPFHGNAFSVYKLGAGPDATAWTRVFTSELAFGHGLAVGTLAGSPAAVVGNRA